MGEFLAFVIAICLLAAVTIVGVNLYNIARNALRKQGKSGA